MKKINFRINNQIISEQVRLIDGDGNMIGIFPLNEAIDRAKAQDLDLIEISSASSPSVCKIAEINKFKYEQQKKHSSIQKNQKHISVKSIQMNLKVSDNDQQTKVTTIAKFLNEGHKVKIIVTFKGREINYHHLGVDLLNKIKEKLVTAFAIEKDIKSENPRRMIMIIRPQKK